VLIVAAGAGSLAPGVPEEGAGVLEQAATIMTRTRLTQ